MPFYISTLMATNLKLLGYSLQSGPLTVFPPQVIGRRHGVYSGPTAIVDSYRGLRDWYTLEEISSSLLELSSDNNGWRAVDLRELREHLDDRLDTIEDKLDDHLERIAKAETNIQWLSGHAKIVVSIVTATLGGLALAVYQLITNKG